MPAIRSTSSAMLIIEVEGSRSRNARRELAKIIAIARDCTA